jgi:predicted GIY-YIG superfamily endonuclease
LRCADDTFYVGHTDDLTSREALHNAGAGANYTALRRPVSLVYSEAFANQQAVLARERQLKRWSARKKEALIAGDLATLKVLSKRRQQ